MARQGRVSGESGGVIEALDLFSAAAAAGGWSLGMERAGFSTMAACEVVPWRRALYTFQETSRPC